MIENVLVTGGRDYNDYNHVKIVMSVLKKTLENIGRKLVITHGGASGLDSLVGDWCTINEVKTHVHPAKWETFGSYAGIRRNQEMLDARRYLWLFAFDGGKGTLDMVMKFKAKYSEDFIIYPDRKFNLKVKGL